MIEWADLVESQLVSYSKEGWKATRLFTYQGATPTGSSTLYLLMTSGNCPERGDPHPTIPNISADIINGEAKDPTTLSIAVNYAVLSAVTAEPDNGLPALLTFGSSVQSQKTVKDYNNDLLICNYDNALGTLYDQYGNPLGTTSSTEADIQLPTNLLRFSRRESTPPDIAAQIYVGWINSDSFTAGMLSTSYDPHTILCTRIDGETQDEGVSFVNTYEFQFKYDTWDVGGFYTPYVDAYDIDGNLLLAGGQTYAGETVDTFQIYGALSFAPLGL